jgi:hypothetical protein
MFPIWSRSRHCKKGKFLPKTYLWKGWIQKHTSVKDFRFPVVGILHIHAYEISVVIRSPSKMPSTCWSWLFTNLRFLNMSFGNSATTNCSTSSSVQFNQSKTKQNQINLQLWKWSTSAICYLIRVLSFFIKWLHINFI